MSQPSPYSQGRPEYCDCCGTAGTLRMVCTSCDPTPDEAWAECRKAERQRDKLQGELEAMRALLAERDAKIRALEARR